MDTSELVIRRELGDMVRKKIDLAGGSEPNEEVLRRAVCASVCVALGR